MLHMQYIRSCNSILIVLLLGGCAKSPDANNPAASALVSPDVQASDKDAPNNPQKKRQKKALGEPKSVRELIPVGSVQADVMELRAPRRLGELTSKLQQAVKKHPDWWLEHVSKAKPGKPLEYDQKLGLSRAEYDEYLKLAGMLTMQKTGVATLTVQDRDGKRFVLDGKNQMPELTGIEIDLEADLVRTPFGEAITRNTIRATPKQPTGPWNGFQWKLQRVDEDQKRIISVNFAIGRLQETGQGVLYYEAKRMHETRGAEEILRVILYDLPEG